MAVGPSTSHYNAVQYLSIVGIRLLRSVGRHGRTFGGRDDRSGFIFDGLPSLLNCFFGALIDR